MLEGKENGAGLQVVLQLVISSGHQIQTEGFYITVLNYVTTVMTTWELTTIVLVHVILFVKQNESCVG